MDAIKKKMQAMKLEKDNAMDQADACEQKAKDANLRAEKAEEEVRDLQKKMQQLESDLDVTQEKLMNANQRLEEKEKVSPGSKLFDQQTFDRVNQFGKMFTFAHFNWSFGKHTWKWAKIRN